MADVTAVAAATVAIAVAVAAVAIGIKVHSMFAARRVGHSARLSVHRIAARGMTRGKRTESWGHLQAPAILQSKARFVTQGIH
ncbi:hypothetical protein D0B32_04055 [Paraburkholderia sp. DHOC27]|nr:hypothetical protein D0B32_04055 [Paraburkholderia sp. DHOC27]